MIDPNTPITALQFKQAFRMRKAIAEYNATVDKPIRIVTVEDLKKSIHFLGSIKGIGKKTLEQIKEAVNA